MREANFNIEVVSSLRTYGAWAYKPSDQPPTFGKTMRFTPSKPCDILGCVMGRFFAIESKQIKEWKSFTIKMLRPNQIVALDDIVKAGGRAYVFLNVRMPRIENRLIIFDWAVWATHLKGDLIKPDSLKNMPFIKGAKEEFDLSEFLKDIVNGQNNG